MSNTNNMSNRETINGVIAFLQASNNEDIALDLANAIVAMDLELERVKGIAGRRLDRIAQLNAQIADLEALADNRLERIMNLLGAIDAKDFDTIQRDNELAAAVDPEQARVELGREPRSHLDL